MTQVRARVLVIDDDEKVGRVAALSLKAFCDVQTLLSVKEALDLIGSGARFEVILCDIMLPELTGADFVERLGVLAPELVDRVICMTGGAFRQRDEDFLAKSGITHIEKPFDVANLRLLVRERIARVRGAFP